MIGVRHGADGVHHAADGRPILAVGRDILFRALAEHIGRHIHPRPVEPVGGVLQKPLNGLGLALVIVVVIVDGARLVIVPGAVGEADIVELNFVEAHGLGGLQGQLHLILPHLAAVYAGPVHAADLQRPAAQVRHHTLRMICGQVGIVEGRDAADDVIPGVLQLFHRRLIALQRVVGIRIGAGGIFLHHRRGVANGPAVHDVHHKGVDAAPVGHGDVCLRIPDGLVVQVQGLHGAGHDVVLEFGLFIGIIVQSCRIAAAVAVAPVGVELGHIRVIGRGGLLLRQPDIPGGDVPAVGPVIGYAAVGRQIPVAGNGQGLAPQHQGAGGVAALIRQILGPADIHGFQRHHAAQVIGQVLPVQPGEAAVLLGHPNLVRTILAGLLHHIGDLAAPDQLPQDIALLVVQRSRLRFRGHITGRRLQGDLLLPGKMPHQCGDGGQAHQSQGDPRPPGAALLPAAPGPGGVFRLRLLDPLRRPRAGLLFFHGHRGVPRFCVFSPLYRIFRQMATPILRSAPSQ